MNPGHPALGQPRIYLASQSPRRRALLAQIGLPFLHLAVAVDETPRAGEAPPDYVARLAVAKARAGLLLAREFPDMAVLGADTSVILDGRILGKPAHRREAREMLGMLSGRAHEVLSAIALADLQRTEVRVNRSEVHLCELDQAAIAAYVATGEPLDKAGAYGIQGLAGAFVRELRGSYSGVMGLPLFETTELLRAFDIPWLGHP